ncbi:YigZ family protein [Lutimonas halocynthiae]|uniref:IMPACT family protein n=1 Tax=Lutimonas halocynthiae TaxID=1446477 RepID=UPI0025B58F4C|nr:YigZ family protein [Lutimonas halocynthiae]MDN3644542.1 YigZ family protein [Lutimonas halocynthiae]
MENIDSDLYQTLEKPSTEQIYKEKGSKFLGYAFPLEHIDQVETTIDQLKKAHTKARHWCYAWQIGVEKPNFRYNDDGEPNNSAGKPIYGQIQSFQLTNVLVVVVRYFGGTKLGVGGLVTAYKTAAKLSLEEANVVTKMLKESIRLEFDYVHMNKVMRIIKEHQLQILNQKMELNCLFEIAVRKNKAEEILKIFEDLRCLDAKMV